MGVWVQTTQQGSMSASSRHRSRKLKAHVLYRELEAETENWKW